MAKATINKMVPPTGSSTEMVDEKPATELTPAQVAELEAKQQQSLPLDETSAPARPEVRGRKALVNMTLPTGGHLFEGQVPELHDEDVKHLHESYGHALDKILAKP